MDALTSKDNKEIKNLNSLRVLWFKGEIKWEELVKGLIIFKQPFNQIKCLKKASSNSEKNFNTTCQNCLFLLVENSRVAYQGLFEIQKYVFQHFWSNASEPGDLTTTPLFLSWVSDFIEDSIEDWENIYDKIKTEIEENYKVKFIEVLDKKPFVLFEDLESTEENYTFGVYKLIGFDILTKYMFKFYPNQIYKKSFKNTHDSTSKFSFKRTNFSDLYSKLESFSFGDFFRFMHELRNLTSHNLLSSLKTNLSCYEIDTFNKFISRLRAYIIIDFSKGISGWDKKNQAVIAFGKLTNKVRSEGVTQSFFTLSTDTTSAKSNNFNSGINQKNNRSSKKNKKKKKKQSKKQQQRKRRAR